MPKHEKIVETIPVGPLGIIALESSKSLGAKINEILYPGVIYGKVSIKKP